MRRLILVGLIVVMLISVGIYKVNPQVSGGKTVKEIYQDVFDKSNGRLMTTANVGAQGANAGLTEQEILQAVYDADNHYLRTSSTGGPGGGTNNWADLISGTSTGDAFVIGTGSSLTATGTGIIDATIAQAAKAALEGCTLGQYAHHWTNQAWKMTCSQVQFSQLGGAATDAQIPHLNTLSTGLTPAKCVQTNASTGLLESSADPCGTSPGGPGVTDGDKGDISVTGGGATWLLDPNTVSFAKMLDIPQFTVMGRDTAGTGDAKAMTVAETKALLPYTKTDVGLGNVDNTSDATKNAATRTETNALYVPRTFAQPNTTPIVIDPFYQRITIAELSQPTTFGVPTGTAPIDGQILEIDVFTTVARALTFLTTANGYCPNHDVSLPTTTIAGKWVTWGFKWLATPSCWSFFGTSQTAAAGGGGVTDALYWTSTPNGGLSAEVNLGALTSGVLCHTVTAGVSAPATCTAGTDYQAPLPNVTNDAQLKRAANDFAAFATKATPVAADLLLIEDSEAAGVKKKVPVSAVRSGSVGTIHLNVGSYMIPSSGGIAALESFGEWLELKFDNVTRECAWWQGRMNSDYVSGLTLKAPFTTTVAAGSFHLDVRLQVRTPGVATAAASEVWGTNNDCNDAVVPGTATALDEISCPLTNNDSIAAGLTFKIELCRDIANDDAAAKVSLIAPVLEYTK